MQLRSPLKHEQVKITKANNNKRNDLIKTIPYIKRLSIYHTNKSLTFIVKKDEEGYNK